MSFKGKVVIVTGASSGIGAAVAIQFAEQGSKVALVARNKAKLTEVAAKCEEYGTKPLMIIADVTKQDDVKKIVTNTVKSFGKIDVLVNNAGILETSSIWEANAMDVFDRVVTTNLRSVVYLTNLAVPHLIESKGNIINISSIAAVHVIARHFAYGVSKAGLDHFTRYIALELAPKGVRVNSVNPGPVQTDLARGLGLKEEKKSEFWKNLENMTALGRVSDPEEIADLVLFVASDKARAITGSCYVTDNGSLLK